MPDRPDDDTEDEQILEQLRAAPPAAWERLEASLAALDSDPAPMTWSGGDRRTDLVNGKERVVTTMPYAVYSDAAEEVRRALAGVGAVFAYDWMSWPRLRAFPGGTGLDEAPVTDAVRLATAVLRSERFTEGSYGGAIADGIVAAVVRRLLVWHRATSPFGER